ncbi:MAG: DNA primase [Bifidobacteriaceae bacterium]|jgi:hypothetical protein|nr:DNA primase [Bifidobacteriaceae bacterium]
MIAEPRAALDRLTAALDQHFAAAASGRGEEDPAYVSAYKTLIDAFETYDEALYEAYGIDTPFLVYDEDAEDIDDDDDDEDDDLEDDDDLFDDDEVDA